MSSQRQGIETTNTGTIYHVQEDGSKVIAPTRRPDGTLRKPIRVRAGYTPLEENIYKGPEVQQRHNKGDIPGMAPEPAAAAAPRAAPQRSGFPPGYFPDEPVAKAKPAKPAKPPKEKQAAPEPAAAKAPAPKAAPAPPAEVKPENRLRNLRKKLTEINALEDRLAAEGSLPEDIMLKVNRKPEIEAEVAQLEQQIAALQL